MSEIALKRPRGRPGAYMTNINDRVMRYKVMEACEKLTPRVLEIWGGWIEDTKYSAVFRNLIMTQIVAYAVGRPAQQVIVDSTNQSVSKIIHEVRWLPEDPNDKSIEVKPEPD
jgi:hypothetical protein